ncbi:hypothetical protein CDAR_275841 [Caerostris darwini]|uniref:Uncharacterized protein n=1 Tax=Caerostris darwini TaxID=1538125 RepID=A0AAV4RR39_9ARAC|nr:hypothetical protein CDAR_275841 [Caerostris darwini]
MKGLILVLCVALVCATFAAAQTHSCPENQHFGSGGTCPDSCKSIKNPGPRTAHHKCRMKNCSILINTEDIRDNIVYLKKRYMFNASQLQRTEIIFLIHKLTVCESF